MRPLHCTQLAGTPGVSARLRGLFSLRAACGIGAITVAATGLLGTFPTLASAAAPPSALGQSYAASTDQADATRAALDIMASGGNAVDVIQWVERATEDFRPHMKSIPGY